MPTANTTDTTTAKCKCGTEREVPANTKVLCVLCGMAHARHDTRTPEATEAGTRYNVYAEDLRGIAVGRDAAQVRQAMRDGGLPEPVTMEDEEAMERVLKRLGKEGR